VNQSSLIFPQDEHEQLLIERLGDAGVEVERQVESLLRHARDQFDAYVTKRHAMSSRTAKQALG